MTQKVQKDKNNHLWISCKEKRHYLTGQLLADKDSLVGIYHKEGFVFL